MLQQPGGKARYGVLCGDANEWPFGHARSCVQGGLTMQSSNGSLRTCTRTHTRACVHTHTCAHTVALARTRTPHGMPASARRDAPHRAHGAGARVPDPRPLQAHTARGGPVRRPVHEDGADLCAANWRWVIEKQSMGLCQDTWIVCIGIHHETVDPAVVMAAASRAPSSTQPRSRAVKRLVSSASRRAGWRTDPSSRSSRPRPVSRRSAAVLAMPMERM